MAPLKCLACGHENKPGDEACASCTTSLNVILCTACEAINAASASECHACGAQLKVHTAQAKAQEKLEPRFEETIEVIEMERPKRSFPSMHVHTLPKAAKVARRAGALLVFGIVFVAGGVASHLWYKNGSASSAGPTNTAQGLIAAPAEPKVAPAPVASGAAATTPPPVAGPASTSGVTHTRAAEAPKVEAPKVTIAPKAAVAPQRKVSPKVAAAARAATPVSAAAVAEPVAPDATYSKVTHTRKAAAIAIEKPLEPPPAVAAPARVPATKEQSNGCAPGVAALGLCK